MDAKEIASRLFRARLDTVLPAERNSFRIVLSWPRFYPAIKCLSLSAFLAGTSCLPLIASDGLVVEELQCEHASNPLGIDTANPRLDWSLRSETRGAEPQAYEVLIATSPDLLARDEGDLWDSGKVASSNTLGIRPDGQPLHSGSRYWWKVRVWDGTGNKSDWSSPAWFETGLLNAGDWTGKWIGTGKRQATAGFDLKSAEWIWYPETEMDLSQYPSGHRWFYETFKVAEDDPLQEATLVSSADNRMHVWINGHDCGESTDWNTPLFKNVTTSLQPGQNQIEIEAENIGQGSAGLLVALRLTTKAGAIANISSDATWKAFDSEPAGWPAQVVLSPETKNARSLGKYGMSPWGSLNLPRLQTSSLVSAPLFRKEFEINNPVASARLYLCGLGLYDAHLNGRPIGNRVLESAHTRYDQRALYSVYDVTNLLKLGTNVWGVELGRGFFSIREKTSWDWKDAVWNQPPAFRGQIILHYQDGTSDIVATDTTWRMNLEGPTLNDSIYWGEIYDARREKSGWMQPGYPDSDWSEAQEIPAPTSQLHVSTMPPIRVIKATTPVSVTNPKPGVYVFDAGFVTSGWAKLRTSAPAGTVVTICYSERINDDGTANRFTLNDTDGPAQTDVYIFKGDGQEEWSPKFSYKGFKYVEVSGMPTPLNVQNLEIDTVHNDVPITGKFECSNPLFNKIHEAVVRTILNNFQSKPTDTPVYEKNGWMGDANVSLEMMFYNLDVASFLGKWADDIFDCQSPTGEIAVMNPTGGWGLGSSPVWDSAAFFVPWHLRQYTGDDSVLTRHLPQIQHYLESEIGALQDGVCSDGLGDWVSPGTDTPRRSGCAPPEGGTLAKTAYLLRSLELYDSLSDEDAQKSRGRPFVEDVDKITAAFNTHFLDSDSGTYHTKIPTELRQTSQVLPLAFGWVPAEIRPKTMAALVKDIHQRGDHLDTGVLGTKYLLSLLTENGEGELAYKIANQTTYPSWGYWLANGATTMWETWELHPRSNDHYFLGTVDEWFYKYLAGINNVENGFKSCIISPYLLGDLTYAQAELKTPRGLLTSGWKRLPNGGVDLRILIPPGCTAKVGVPSTGLEPILESGQPAEHAPGVQFLQKDTDRAWYEVVSGAYKFTSSIRAK